MNIIIEQELIIDALCLADMFSSRKALLELEKAIEVLGFAVSVSEEDPDVQFSFSSKFIYGKSINVATSFIPASLVNEGNKVILVTNLIYKSEAIRTDGKKLFEDSTRSIIGGVKYFSLDYIIIF